MVESVEENKLIVGKHALSPVRESSGSLTLFNTLELDLLLRWCIFSGSSTYGTEDPSD